MYTVSLGRAFHMQEYMWNFIDNDDANRFNIDND